MNLLKIGVVEDEVMVAQDIAGRLKKLGDHIVSGCIGMI